MNFHVFQCFGAVLSKHTLSHGEIKHVKTLKMTKNRWKTVTLWMNCDELRVVDFKRSLVNTSWPLRPRCAPVDHVDDAVYGGGVVPGVVGNGHGADPRGTPWYTSGYPRGPQNHENHQKIMKFIKNHENHQKIMKFRSVTRTRGRSLGHADDHSDTRSDGQTDRRSDNRTRGQTVRQSDTRLNTRTRG